MPDLQQKNEQHKIDLASAQLTAYVSAFLYPHQQAFSGISPHNLTVGSSPSLSPQSLIKEQFFG